MKKIGIVMMTYFSGKAYKAPQMPEIIHRLMMENQLGESFGMPYKLDEKEYSPKELSNLKRSNICRLMFGIISNFTKHVKKIPYVYQKYEKVYGVFAKMHYRKEVPEVVVMKPRPSFLIEHMKRKGAYVIVEASENHSRFTYSQIKTEAERLGVETKESSFVNDKAVLDYERGIDLADGLICLTEYSKKTYTDRGFAENKIKVVPLNIDMPVEEPNKLNGELYFVSVAMHSLLKGTYRLVKVWKDYKIKSKLIIVGPLDNELKQMIDKLGPLENVEFWGYKNQEFMKQFYCSHRCVGVLLSFSESFGRSIYECMCTSSPVIVTPYCTLDMVVDGENGKIVNPESEAEIYAAVQKMESLSEEEFYEIQCNVHHTMMKHKIDFGKEYVRAINELAQS